jgi:membrane protein implicated in regulation of membrane protease activity
MSVVYLLSFIIGLLLAVRIMFFGAERRRIRSPDALPLRRSEPAVAAFLVMFGIAGYLFTRPGRLSPAVGVSAAAALGALWALVVTRLAIATARVQPEHDPEDPRYVLQGHVAMVTVAIPVEGEGTIVYGEADASRSLPARSIDGQAIESGMEVCIDRVESGVAFVELWALVEARL